MAPYALDDRVKAGLAALERHAWRESYDLLKGADGDGLLGGPELEQLGQAAWWLRVSAIEASAPSDTASTVATAANRSELPTASSGGTSMPVPSVAVSPCQPATLHRSPTRNDCRTSAPRGSASHSTRNPTLPATQARSPRVVGRRAAERSAPGARPC